MADQLLILISAAPPYSPGEEFLNDEYPLLEERFDKILVVHHDKSYAQPTLPSSKYELVYFPYLPDGRDKRKSLRFVFSFLFWDELYQMIFRYRLLPTPQRMALLLGSLAVGNKLYQFLYQKIQKGNHSQAVVYSYWCNFMAVGVSLLKRRVPSITAVTRAHGYDLYFERSPSRYQPMRSLIYRTLDAVYFISRLGLDYATSKNGFFPTFKVSYLGCQKIELRSSWPVNPILQLASCSAAIPLKRIHLIIEALSLHHDHTQPLCWTHFGEGPMMDQLKSLAVSRLGHLSHITFEFKGYVKNPDLLAYYGQGKVDLLINVSESEGLPFSFMEAFAAGIPVMATDVGAVSEMVVNHTNGILLNANPTPEEILEVLRAYQSLGVAGREVYQRNARETWATRFDARLNYTKFITDISSLKSS